MPPGSDAAPVAAGDPVDVAGAFLVCAQTDAPAAAAAPSQDDLVAGEAEIELGCFEASQSGVKLASALEGATLTAALRGRSAPVALKSILADAASPFHFFAKVPEHVAADVTAFTAAVTAGGKQATIPSKAVAAIGTGVAALPAAPFAYISAVLRKDGPTTGHKLVIIRGQGLAAATGVTLGSHACDRISVYGDHMVGCETPMVTTPEADLTVTVSLPGGEARIGRAYSFVAQSVHPCDNLAALALEAIATRRGGASGTYQVCTRDELLTALRAADATSVQIMDNIQLGDEPWPEDIPKKSSFHLDGQGFVLQGLTISDSASPAKGLLSSVDAASVIESLGLVEFRITSGSNDYLGAVVGQSVATTFKAIYLGRGGIDNGAKAAFTGGVVGNALDAAFTDIVIDGVSVSGSGQVGGVAGNVANAIPLSINGLRVDAQLQCNGFDCGTFGTLDATGTNVVVADARIRLALSGSYSDGHIGGIAGVLTTLSCSVSNVHVVLPAPQGAVLSRIMGGLFASVFASGVMTLSAIDVSGTMSQSAEESGNAAVAGLIGDASLQSQLPVQVTVRSVTSDVDISGHDTVGGLIGLGTVALTASDVRVSGKLSTLSHDFNIAGIAPVAASLKLNHVLVLSKIVSADNEDGQFPRLAAP